MMIKKKTPLKSEIMINELSFGLPEVIPLLPTRGVILMPRSTLPVPILDPGQAALIASCLQADKHYIGIIQSNSPTFDGHILSPTFSIGCLAEIIEFGTTNEDNLVVLLRGIIRFDIVEELAPCEGYRQARVNYDRYSSDRVEIADFSMDRDRLLRALKQYLTAKEIKADWEEISQATNDQLLNGLSMACPFLPREKQAVLESQSPQEQSKIVTSLIEMAALDYNKAENETFH